MQKSLQQKLVFFVLLGVLIGIQLLIGCSIENETKLPITNTSFLLPTKYETLELTSTQIIKKAITPTKIPTSIYNLDLTLEVTQSPLEMNVTTNVEKGYLYKDLVVKITFVDQFNAIAFINLDDLSDNGLNNSDVLIRRTFGNEFFYSISPVNNAFYGDLGKSTSNYENCSKKFPISVDLTEYLVQATRFIYSDSYCFLTNEGRMATVKYIEGSRIRDGSTETVDVLITVYSPIEEK